MTRLRLTSAMWAPFVAVAIALLALPRAARCQPVGGSLDEPREDSQRVNGSAKSEHQMVEKLTYDGIYNPYGVDVDPLYEIRSTPTPGEGDLEVSVQAVAIPPENIYLVDRSGPTKRREMAVDVERDRISPVLRTWLRYRDPGTEVDVIVTWEDDLRIPRLPELDLSLGRDDREAPRRLAIEEIIRQREESRAEFAPQVERCGRSVVTQGFWLANSVVVNTTLDQVPCFAGAPGVTYVQPARGGEPPPDDGIAANDPTEVRKQIASDPYYDLGLIHPWIGLVDTGVDPLHTLFVSPDRLAWLRDCVHGGQDCANTTAAGFDTSDSHDHGTRTAGILSGNGNLGDELRGITAIQVDSWKVYAPVVDLDTPAAAEAMQMAIAVSDWVIVGEVQASESEWGLLAQAADNAYDSGAVVVAANGNFGPQPKSVRSPAIAHKVLGVGALEVVSGDLYSKQSRGPTADGRYKPDIQAPTGFETARVTTAEDSATLTLHGASSGATGVAGGAAMLTRNWLREHDTIDNGQTYAFMILSGENEWPYDVRFGAGRIRMPTNGIAWWGKVAVSHSMNIDIPITVPDGKHDLDVALWWPESVWQHHNDIDVHVIDPEGAEQAQGLSSRSVFERTGVSGKVKPGIWTVRIRGYDVKCPQTVYWAVHIRND